MRKLGNSLGIFARVGIKVEWVMEGSLFSLFSQVKETVSGCKHLREGVSVIFLWWVLDSDGMGMCLDQYVSLYWFASNNCLLGR